MKIERKSGVPIYIQVKNQIIDDIKNRRIKIGEKLPTERELSQKLKVSRNTISAAYNLLEQEGVLISYQGRGTFVAEEGKTWKKHTTKNKINRFIDIALEEAIETGLNTKEFISLVQERVREKELIIKNINAIFVECNIEQARFFADELSRVIDFHVLPMTVSELQNQREDIKEIISRTQIIITAFNHVHEVKSLIVDMKKEVFGIACNPNLETIVKIAKFPKETKFGQISLSKEFQFKVQYALKSAGLRNFVMNATTSKDKKDLLRVIGESDVIIVSPGREEEVKRLVNNQKDVIKFDYVLDRDSVKAILSMIMETK